MKTSTIIATVLFATASLSATSTFAQNDPYGGNIYYGEPGENGYQGSYPINLNEAPVARAPSYTQISSTNSASPSALDGTVAISDFKVEPQGDVIRFTVAGHPNGKATVKFANHSVVLTENRAGIYTGFYLVSPQDNFVGKSFNAQMALKEGKRTNTYNMYQTFATTQVASVPVQPQGYQPPATWTSRYENAGSGGYRPNYPQYQQYQGQNYGYNGNGYNPRYQQYQQQQYQQPNLNPNNIGQVVDVRVQQVATQHTSIVGSLVGGGAGGLIGSTIGRGNGRLWATGAGAVGGALVGNQIGGQGYQNVWTVVVQFQSGSTATYAFQNQPPMQVGSVVQRVGNGITPVNVGY